MAENVKHAFLSRGNVVAMANKLRQPLDPTAKKMYKWVNKYDKIEAVDQQLESVGFVDVMEFLNEKFYDEMGSLPFAEVLDSHQGGRYPKLYMVNTLPRTAAMLGRRAVFPSGVEGYGVEDYRAMDCFLEQDIKRTDGNFRYNNRLMKWESCLYARNYDRADAASTFRDIRELDNQIHGYDMSGVVRENPFTSSESAYYNM